MKFPDFLKKGDIIRLITPSGAVEPDSVAGAIEVLTSWGFRPQTGTYALTREGRYAGTVNQRLQDIEEAFLDPDVKAIFCTRGGYGVVHLLETISPGLIKDHPKWLIGYSDITALHAMCSCQGVVSLHAPMCKHLAETGGEDLPSQDLRNILTGNFPEYDLPPHELSVYGEAEGTLIGGNMAVYCGLRGTHFDTTMLVDDPILFLEDIGEKPYQIDRMLYNLELGGVFKKLKALIIGQFTDYEEDPLMYQGVLQSVRMMMDKYGIPVIFDFPVGHTAYNRPLICGASVKLTKDKLIYI
ncbi:MAG: S66 peptidase family protein [Bacteroidales bacterium]